MSLVSVIVPSYNRANTLQGSLNSILNQTYRSFEIIVVDDGSTDNTPALMDVLTQQHHQVRYITHSSNRGAQAARNTGIKAAKGEWIAFLDSDDRWLPKSLEIRIRFAQKGRYQVVYSACYVMWENGKKEIFTIPPFRGFMYRQLLTQPGPMFQSLLVSRNALRQIGYLDENLVSWQEWDTSIRLAEHFSFGFVTEPTFIYDCRGGDTISQNRLHAAIGYEQIIYKHASVIRKFAGVSVLLKHCREIAFRYKQAGQPYASQYYPTIMSVYAHIAFIWRTLRLRTLLQKTQKCLNHLRARLFFLR